MAHPADVLETVVGTVESGGRAALCVIVATRGSTPQPAGVMVCVDEEAKMTGTLGGWPIDGSTYIVIVTRGHRHDERALAAVYGSPAKFIGMIGSRRKVDVVFKDLKQDGAMSEQLARVHAPIGLNINAVTVEEIVVSICAQLVSVRRADYAGAVQGPIPLSKRGP